jgi:hypothetical protein
VAALPVPYNVFMDYAAMRQIGDILKTERNIILKGADAATKQGFTQVPNFLLKSKKLSAGEITESFRCISTRLRLSSHRTLPYGQCVQSDREPRAFVGLFLRVPASTSTTTSSAQQYCANRLFNHVISTQQNRLRHRQTKRLGGLEVHGHLKFCRQLNG